MLVSFRLGGLLSGRPSSGNKPAQVIVESHASHLCGV